MPKKAANKLKGPKKREDCQELTLAEAKVYFNVKAKSVIEVVTDTGRKTIDVKNIPEGPKASYEHVLNPEYLKTGPPYYICAKNFFHAEDGQIDEFFSEIECTSVKLPGFAAGFQRNDHIFKIDDVENLKKALLLDGKQFNNRAVVVELHDINAETYRKQRPGFDRYNHDRGQSSVMDRYKSMMGDDECWQKELSGMRHGTNDSRPQDRDYFNVDWKAKNVQGASSERPNEEPKSLAFEIDDWKEHKKSAVREERVDRNQQQIDLYNQLKSADKWHKDPHVDREGGDCNVVTDRGSGMRNQDHPSLNVRGQRSPNTTNYLEVDWKNKKTIQRGNNGYSQDSRATGNWKLNRNDESAESRAERYKSYSKGPSSSDATLDKWTKAPPKTVSDFRTSQFREEDKRRKPANNAPIMILQNPNSNNKGGMMNDRRQTPRAKTDGQPRQLPNKGVNRGVTSKKQERETKPRFDKRTLVKHEDGFYGCDA